MSVSLIKTEPMKLDENDKISLKIFLSLMFCLIVYGSIANYFKACQLKENLIITASKTYNKSTGRGENNIFIIEFSDAHSKINEIEKAAFYGNDAPKFGQFYITLVDIETKHAVLLSNCPIPADLKIPKKGWKKLPIASYQKEVDAYFEEALNSGINQLFPKCE